MPFSNGENRSKKLLVEDSFFQRMFFVEQETKGYGPLLVHIHAHHAPHLEGIRGGMPDLDARLSNLEKRQFLLYQAKKSTQEFLFRRHPMCYRFGPFTRAQVAELMADHKAAMAAAAPEPEAAADSGAPPAPAAGESLALDLVIAAHIRRVLGMTGGKIHGPGGAGELLGVNPNTLRNRMKKLGIRRPQ